jgi:ribosomal protein S18 acetylase RimI-like enzyme
MPDITIRDGGEADRAWAAGLLSTSEPWITLKLSYDVCLRSCSSPTDHLYIAWMGSTPCGLALVRERGLAGAPYLVSIAVADMVRGQGIGARILAFVEGLYRPRFRHLFLCVSSFNVRARAFYERSGFVAVGLLPDFIINGADEVLMLKRLQPPGA